MIGKVLLFVWIVGWLLAGFLWAPLVPVLGDTTRIVYFHIPSAWIAVLALGWSMVFSLLYLWKRRLEFDDHAVAAAELGILFCVGATVSGALWAKAQWGAYWNWDPRETSIFFVLLIYGAYLALRSSIEGEERRARLSAVYSALAFVSVPFLMFVVPRVFASLHPAPILPARGEKGTMDPRIVLTFVAMLTGFTALFFWVMSLKVRVLRLERRRRAAEAAGASKP